ncbi:MAG TPA: N-acetylglucosamine-6-phosphate deacetylase [Baekduia sp.]|uniref:N-acetylglucosamine-6-phosphate deacetylase n=1 Tax=Baekduia sp. TaxID=2600305 RepID=UPI002D767AD4|nr:N-acetylglucosamine-6-phosphate deacetylase [Baekduia sp.]HET6510464.1 N-acetylglucosamine-6-phosphate deacetylase [Baekduia sp.]
MSGPVPDLSGPMRLGVRAALVDGALVEGDVVVAEGRVLEVGVGGGEGAGRGIAVPGFLDLHINGIVGVDFLAAGPEGYAAASAALAASGVTGYLPTFITSPMGDYPAALAAVAEAMAAEAPGARVLGVHLEGPYLSPAWPGAHDPAQLREPDVAEALALVAGGPVKMMTLAPERPGGLDLVEALAARGVVVSVGHTDADAATANAAFDRGARAITHLYNAHRRWTARDPGVAGAALVRPGVTVQAIVDHVHLAPEAAYAAFLTARERFSLVTDAMEAAGQGDGVYRLGRREVSVHGARAELSDGLLAGSVLTMDAAVRNLHACGATFEQAVWAATGAPAHLLGDPSLGALQVDGIADVTVLDDDLRVMRTLVAGVERFAAAPVA